MLQRSNHKINFMLLIFILHFRLCKCQCACWLWQIESPTSWQEVWVWRQWLMMLCSVFFAFFTLGLFVQFSLLFSSSFKCKKGLVSNVIFLWFIKCIDVAVDHSSSECVQYGPCIISIYCSRIECSIDWGAYTPYWGCSYGVLGAHIIDVISVGSIAQCMAALSALPWAGAFWSHFLDIQSQGWGLPAR